MLFIKIYEIARPFSDSYAGSSKNIAQWQILLIFFVVLIIKENILGSTNSGLLSMILIFILFFNLILDIIVIAILLINPGYLYVLGIVMTRSSVDSTHPDNEGGRILSRFRDISSSSNDKENLTIKSTELKVRRSSITGTMSETDSPLFATNTNLNY